MSAGFDDSFSDKRSLCNLGILSGDAICGRSVPPSDGSRTCGVVEEHGSVVIHGQRRLEDAFSQGLVQSGTPFRIAVIVHAATARRKPDKPMVSILRPNKNP